MAWTTPRTWLAGEKPSAATYNTHIRDNFNAIGAQWLTYAPTWAAATTNPVIGNGTILGNYMQAGKLVSYRVRIVMGSTTTYGSGVYTISLPVTALVIQNDGYGHWLNHTGFVPNPVMAIGNTTNVFRMVPTSGTTYATATFPFTLTATDEIVVCGTYEAA